MIWRRFDFKSHMRHFITLVFLLGLVGCANVPLAPVNEDTRAKEFTPDPSKASIYIFRDEGFIGAARTISVLIDGVTVGSTAPKTYFLIQVTPGKHKLASTEGKFYSLDLNVEAGKLYFVRHIPHIEMWGVSGSFEIVSEDRGKKGLQECKLAPNLF